MGCDLPKMGSKFYNKNLWADRKLHLDKNQLPGVSTQANFRPFNFFPPEWHEQYDWVILLKTIEQNWQMHNSSDYEISAGPSQINSSYLQGCYYNWKSCSPHCDNWWMEVGQAFSVIYSRMCLQIIFWIRRFFCNLIFLS